MVWHKILRIRTKIGQIRTATHDFKNFVDGLLHACPHISATTIFQRHHNGSLDQGVILNEGHMKIICIIYLVPTFKLSCRIPSFIWHIRTIIFISPFFSRDNIFANKNIIEYNCNERTIGCNPRIKTVWISDNDLTLNIEYEHDEIFETAKDDFQSYHSIYVQQRFVWIYSRPINDSIIVGFGEVPVSTSNQYI